MNDNHHPFADVFLCFSLEVSTPSPTSPFALLKSQITRKKFLLQKIHSKLLNSSSGKYSFNERIEQLELNGAPYLAFDQQRGILYMSDENIHAIFAVTVATGRVELVAGNPKTSATVNGHRTETARFGNQRAIAVDSIGNLFVSDNNQHTIRKIDFQTNMVTTVCGLNAKYGDQVGAGEEARMYYPNGIAIDHFDNIFVCDSGNKKLRRVTPEGVMSDMNLCGISPNWFSTISISDPFAPDNLYIGDRDGDVVFCFELDKETHSKVISARQIGKKQGGIYGVFAYDRKVYVHKSSRTVMIDIDGDDQQEQEVMNFNDNSSHCGDLVGDVTGCCLYISNASGVHKIQ